MVRYILDTDIFTLWTRDQMEVDAYTLMNPPGSIAISVVTVEEQIGGRLAQLRQIKTKDETQKKREILRVYDLMTESARGLKLLPIVPFTDAAYDHFEPLDKMKLNFDIRNDLRIAAIALDLGAVVVTRNVRDFERVPGLVVENWAG